MSDELYRQITSRHSGFGRVPRDTLTELCQSAETLAIKHKHPLFRRGEDGPGLFIVKRGVVKLSLFSQEGREQIMYIAEPGKMVMEGFLPKGEKCAASAFAMMDSHVWWLPNERLWQLLRRSHPLSIAIMHHMSFRRNRMIELVLDLSLRSVGRRLASFLLTLAMRTGAEQGTPCVIPRCLDMNTVAARLGTSREDVSRALHRMQGDGILSLSRHAIVIHDLDRLEQAIYE